MTHYVEGDPDCTVAMNVARSAECLIEDTSGFVCTVPRDMPHVQHLAGDGVNLCAVWPSSAAAVAA
jgi:hypothetical protein